MKEKLLSAVFRPTGTPELLSIGWIILVVNSDFLSSENRPFCNQGQAWKAIRKASRRK